MWYTLGYNVIRVMFGPVISSARARNSGEFVVLYNWAKRVAGPESTMPISTSANEGLRVMWCQSVTHSATQPLGQALSHLISH